MEYLRGVVGATWKDRVRNDDIRKRLKVKSIIQKVEEKQRHWLEWGNRQVEKI